MKNALRSLVISLSSALGGCAYQEQRPTVAEDIPSIAKEIYSNNAVKRGMVLIMDKKIIMIDEHPSSEKSSDGTLRVYHPATKTYHAFTDNGADGTVELYETARKRGKITISEQGQPQQQHQNEYQTLLRRINAILEKKKADTTKPI